VAAFLEGSGAEAPARHPQAGQDHGLMHLSLSPMMALRENGDFPVLGSKFRNQNSDA
jgi:hypothetical protein